MALLEVEFVVMPGGLLCRDNSHRLLLLPALCLRRERGVCTMSHFLQPGCCNIGVVLLFTELTAEVVPMGEHALINWLEYANAVRVYHMLMLVSSPCDCWWLKPARRPWATSLAIFSRTLHYWV